MRKGAKVIYRARASVIGLIMQPNQFVLPYHTQVGRVQRIKPHKYLNHVVEYPDGTRLSFHKANLQSANRKIKVH